MTSSADVVSLSGSVPPRSNHSTTVRVSAPSKIAGEHRADRRANQIARDLLGAAQLAFVFELELAGDRRQRRVEVGDARHDQLFRRCASARRSAFETTSSSVVIGRRWLTPERLSILRSARAWNATSSTTSRTYAGISTFSAGAIGPGFLRA